MTRSERLEAALVSLVRENRAEIDAIRDMHGVQIGVTLDDNDCIEYMVLGYEKKRHRRRLPNTRSQVA